MKKTYEELKGTEKEVCDLCRTDQKACDSNTELCIAIWDSHWTGEKIFDIIRKYPPESLTKYRRNLVEWGLITPSKASREHSREMEAQNHKTEQIHNFENETVKRLFELRPIIN